MKGERKIGGPIADCRAVYLRKQTYAIIYENVPTAYDKEDVDEIKFRGVTKHDNQANARTGSDDPKIAMKRFELAIPASESARLHSALKDSNGVYVNDDAVKWDNPTELYGQFERRHEDKFRSIASEGEIRDIERLPLREVLENPSN
ncbi:hypothetical protein [Halorussus caseinilyticus]|uniref:FHA domain-containing protein n=1 Tax=Halorussus caseinilyticus TaxID=3034025 RepID=A0ABD5WGN2_9EURY|nr:hypothetical protein [Halorussus sp. DT72]